MSVVWLSNVIAYSAQLAALVASAFVAARVTRLYDPRPSLHLWQATLVIAIALPVVQSASAPATDGEGRVTSIVVDAVVEPARSLGQPDVAVLALIVLAFGVIARLSWIAIGLARLRGIRRRSRPTSLPRVRSDVVAGLGVHAETRVSREIDSPVTIGLYRPVILLPPRMLDLPAPVQEAILSHELIHVRRRDWLFVVAEQIWAALLWFHPAARLLISRVSLMREALVDRETLALTRDRRAYAQALLTFAEPTPAAPTVVPSLIRPRHLTHRIALISQQESPMSLRHVIAALVVGAAIVSSVTAAGVSRFPIVVGPHQEEPVRPGKDVTLPRVVKEVKPEYTPAALQAKIQGDVEMDVIVQANGDPSEVTITRSLDTVHGLDEAAMRAASQWRFEPGRRDGKPVPVIITVQMTFTLK